LLPQANSRNASALRSTRGEHGRPEDKFDLKASFRYRKSVQKVKNLGSEEKRTPAFCVRRAVLRCQRLSTLAKAGKTKLTKEWKWLLKTPE
jgi:hypothetical protein